MWHTRYYLGLVLIGVVQSACVHTPTPNPLPPFEVPPQYANAPADTKSPSHQWWKDFEDSTLNKLVAQALSDNFELGAAWARLAQAGALAKQAGAGLWPTITAETSIQRRSSADLGASATSVPLALISQAQPTWSASLRASYEIDIWGKLSAQKQAAALDLQANRDRVEALAMTIAAELSESYLSLVAQRARRTLLLAQLDTNQTLLNLVLVRFDQGLASALDIYQMRQQVALSKGLLSQTEANIELLKHQLAVLIGHTPTQISFGSNMTLPPMPALPNPGVPAQLLSQRPDVRMSRHRVEAADVGVGIALANLFPALKLTGSIGFSAQSLSELVNEVIWSAIGGLTQPIFAGNSLRAETERSRAVLKEQLQSFAQIVLRAIIEVETALVQERDQRTQLAHLQEQETNAQAALREARTRYLEGLSDFLQVLTTLQSLQRVEQQRLSAERQLRSYRIQLCRAIGGSWTHKLSPPNEDQHEQT